MKALAAETPGGAAGGGCRPLLGQDGL